MAFEDEPRPDDQEPHLEAYCGDGRIFKEPDVPFVEALPSLDTPKYDFIHGDYSNDSSTIYGREYEPGSNLPLINHYAVRPDQYIIPHKSLITPEVLKSLLENTKPRNFHSTDSIYGAKPVEEEQKPEKTGPTLDDIGGYDAVKTDIRKFLAAAQHPDNFKAWGAKPPKGLLLYGPPGTGKTLFAKAIATELDGHFESISPADINLKYFGDSEARIKKLFEDARVRPGHTVIFIDEIDSMLPKRNAEMSGGVNDSIMTMFLQCMDGKDSPDNVTIIGATNRLDVIDPAVLRPGRMDRKIEIGYPDPEARAAILNIHIAAVEKVAGRQLFDLDKTSLDLLLEGADVLTGAQIAEVVRRVCETKAYESIENDDPALANVGDLIASFASLIAESARYDS